MRVKLKTCSYLRIIKNQWTLINLFKLSWRWETRFHWCKKNQSKSFKIFPKLAIQISIYRWIPKSKSQNKKFNQYFLQSQRSLNLNYPLIMKVIQTNHLNLMDQNLCLNQLSRSLKNLSPSLRKGIQRDLECSAKKPWKISSK